MKFRYKFSNLGQNKLESRNKQISQNLIFLLRQSQIFFSLIIDTHSFCSIYSILFSGARLAPLEKVVLGSPLFEVKEDKG